MATDKKSFVLYADLIHTVRKMPKDKVSDLFLTILSFVNDENPVVEDMLVDLVFEPIKNQLKRDLKSWESTLEAKSISGRMGNVKRWNLDLYNKIISKEITLEEAEIIAERRKVSHSDKGDRTVSQAIANIAVNVTDTVTVNDTVNVNDNVIEIKKEIPQQVAFDDFWKLYNKSADKPACEKKWGKLKYEDQCKIMIHLPEYVKSTPDKKFRKNPQSYLNAKAWENEIISKNSSTAIVREIKPNGFPNPQTYYMECWDMKIKPVRWENGDILSESEIEAQYKLHKVGPYQYA